MGLKIKKWLTDSRFELREARTPKQTPSGRLQARIREFKKTLTAMGTSLNKRFNEQNNGSASVL